MFAGQALLVLARGCCLAAAGTSWGGLHALRDRAEGYSSGCRDRAEGYMGLQGVTSVPAAEAR